MASANGCGNPSGKSASVLSKAGSSSVAMFDKTSSASATPKPAAFAACGKWRGTTSLIQGQQVRVYVGLIGDRTRLIGTANVDATGAWLVNTANNSGPNPGAATTVWAESSLPGTPGQLVFTR